MLDTLAFLCGNSGMDEYFERVKARVLKEKGRYRQLAEQAGCSYSWLTKFAAGKYDNKNVGVRQLQRLDDLLKDRPQ